MVDRVQPGGTVGLYNPEGIDTEKSAPFNPRIFFGQGTLLSTGDELEAWVKSKLTGRPSEQIRQEINAKNAAFKAKYPVESAYQEFAGAAFPSVVSSIFPPLELATMPRAAGALNILRKTLGYNPEAPIKSGVKIGTTYGGIGGAGAGEPGSRLESGLYGGLGGAALGFAVPVTGSAASYVGRGIADLIRGGPTEAQFIKRAQDKLIEQMRSAGVTKKDLMNMSEEDYRSLGIPSSIAHYLPETTEAVITKGGAPEIATLEKKLVRTQRGETSRVEQRLKDKLRPGDYYADEDAITAQLRNNARNMYDEAYAAGEINDPRIFKVLENPTFKKAFEEAQNISKTEAAAAELAGEDASKFALREIYVPKEVKPGIFEMELKEVPDVRTLDYIKRGLDAIIEKGYKGEGMSTAQANALRKLRNQFVAAIDENVPAYKTARANYAGDMEVKEALNLGKTDFNKMDFEQIQNFMAGASEAEKEAYRTGAMRYLQNNLFDRPNAAGRIVNSEKMTKKLQALFDSPEEFALVKAALEKEALLYQNASKSLTGSRTAIKQEAAKTLEKEPEGVAEKVFGGGSLVSGIMHMFRDEKLPPQVIGKMADMLSAGSPSEVAAVVRALEKREKVGKFKSAAGAAATAGTIKGTEGGTTLPEVSPDVSGGDIILNELMDYYDQWKLGPVKAPSAQ